MGSPLVLALLVGGAVVLVLWAWFELRVGDPVVELRVSSRAPVLLTNLATIAMGFAMFAAQVAFPQLLELPPEVGGMGLSLLQIALVLLPYGGLMLLMSPITGRLLTVWGPRPPFIIGAALIAIGYLLALVLKLDIGAVVGIHALFGIGTGLGYAAIPALIMRAVPASETGAANGVNTLMRGLGHVLAATVIAVVLAASAVARGDVQAPSLNGFFVAFWLGLGAAVLCAITAACIPRPGAPGLGTAGLRRPRRS